MNPVRLCFLVFVMLAGGLAAQAPMALRVTADYRGMPLTEVILLLEADYGLGFNFLPAALEGKVTDCTFDKADWAEIEACLFTANELEARLLPRGYVSLLTAETPTDTLLEQLSIVDLETVFVAEYVTDGITASPDGREVSIRPEKSPPVPGFADGELSRTLSLLPGISNLNESAGDLSIRGGARDQNLVLWDGIPVYSSGHYFGMISNFSPELVDRVDVWRGQADASYGGRVAGVIRFETERDITKKWRGGIGSSLLQTDAFVKAPLISGRSDIHLSGRVNLPGMVEGPAYQSYREQLFQANQFARLLSTETTPLPSSEDFQFYELNGRWQYQLGRGQNLVLSGYAQRDDFNFQIGQGNLRRFYQDRLRSENHGLGLGYERELPQGKKLSVRAVITDFSNEGATGFGEGRSDLKDVRASGIQESSLHLRYRLPAGAEGRVELGGQAQAFKHRFLASRDNQLTNRQRFSVRNGEALATAFFGSYRWTPQGAWRAELGLRVPYYSPTGQLYLEPRLHGNYQLTERWLLKAAYGINHQFAQELISLEPNIIAASAPLWTLAGTDDRFPVQAGREASFGIAGQPKGWLFDLEVYRKRVTGLSTLNLGVHAGESRGPGALRATGMDLLVKHRRGNWRGWAIYSLSKTEWRFPPQNDRFFPANNDRRHQLRLVNTYGAGPWSFSLAWRVQSGARYTEATGVRLERGDDGRVRPSLRWGAPNDAQLPTYHRLDLSVFYDWGKTAEVHGRIGLSLLNLYGQNNLLERKFLLQEAEQTGLQDRRFQVEAVDRTGLGFTPNLRLSFGWH